MGTEVLRSQDYWVERNPAFHGRRINSPTKGNQHGYTKANHISNNNSNNNNKKRHHNQKISSSPNDSKDVSRHSNNGNDLEVGQVTIVRRGDSLDSLNSRIKKDRSKKPVFSTADLYAGSAFSSSPPPSALPLPSFFKKQELRSFDDSATRDLRRLLRLE